MALDAVINFGKVTVSTGYDASATSIALTSGHGAKLPAPSTDGNFNLVWWNSTDYQDPADDPNVEIVRCTARSTDTLTVTRAQEGTSGSTKNTANKTYKMALGTTKKMMDDIESGLPIVGSKALTDQTATGIFEVALTAGSMTGGTVIWSIEVKNATAAYQSLSGITTYAALNDAGSYTTTVNNNTSNDAKAVNNGTLTTVWDALAGTNKITIRVNADTSITAPTVFNVYYAIINNSSNAITLL